MRVAVAFIGSVMPTAHRERDGNACARRQSGPFELALEFVACESILQLITCAVCLGSTWWAVASGSFKYKITTHACSCYLFNLHPRDPCWGLFQDLISWDLVLTYWMHKMVSLDIAKLGTPFILNYNSFKFFIASLTSRLIKKLKRTWHLFLWFDLLIKILQEWLKFNYMYTFF